MWTRELVGTGVDTIVAAGGDGSINAVVNGLVGSHCRLGVIPAGTANDLAASVGLPGRMADACQVILQGRVRQIDVIRVNSWHFITSGGVGLPVAVLETVDHLRGSSRWCARRLGSGLYPMALLYHLIRGAGKAQNVELILDGRKLDLSIHALLVSNLQRIGKYMCIAPRADAADGRLHLFALEAAGSRLQVALSALSTLARQEGRHHGVRMLSGRRLVLNMERATTFCADGETRLCSSSFRFDVVPGGVQLICPR